MSSKHAILYTYCIYIQDCKYAIQLYEKIKTLLLNHWIEYTTEIDEWVLTAFYEHAWVYISVNSLYVVQYICKCIARLFDLFINCLVDWIIDYLIKMICCLFDWSIDWLFS